MLNIECFFLILTEYSKGNITSCLQRNFELKHVTMVTDLRCFEEPGPGLLFHNNLILIFTQTHKLFDASVNCLITDPIP